MAWTDFGWADAPAELAPQAGETVADWYARIAAYDAANPGTLTSLKAVELEDFGQHVYDKAIADAPGGASVPDADATTKGKVQLAGDLTGTAASPQIAAGAVGTTELGANAVTAAKVAADVATQAELDGHINDTSAAHAASAIAFTPTGTVAATDVQAAIAEVASEAGGAGAADASTTVKGVTKLDVAPSSATNPIAVGTNSPRAQPQAAASANLTGTVTVDFASIAQEKWLPGPLTGNLIANGQASAVAGSRLRILAVQGSPARTITVDGNAVTPISQTNGALILVDVLYVDVGGTITPRIIATTTEIDPNAVLKSLVDAAGDLIIATADDTVGRLPIGASGRVLTSDGTTASWQDTANAGKDETVNTVGTSGTAQTIPAPTTASVSRITLTANCTLTFPTAAAGRSFTVVLAQDATGGRTVTWPTVLWPGGTTPTLTATANKRDVFTFLCADGTNWLGFVAGQNL